MTNSIGMFNFFINSIFRNNITTSMIFCKILQLAAAKIMEPTNEQEDVLVRLYLCLLFNCFLFTNELCKLVLGLLRYIEELDMLHALDCIATITRYTLGNISNYHDQVNRREDGESGPKFRLNGCPSALQESLIDLNV